jgi:hypothetical protein
LRLEPRFRSCAGNFGISLVRRGGRGLSKVSVLPPPFVRLRSVDKTFDIVCFRRLQLAVSARLANPCSRQDWKLFPRRTTAWLRRRIFRLRTGCLGRRVRERPMRWCEKAKFLNLAVSVFAVLAWFTGPNHCLLGVMHGTQGIAFSVSHCPEHSKASGQTDDRGMLACCQGLVSPNIDLTKTKISFSPILVGIHLFATDDRASSEAPKGIHLTARDDTGPPSAGCFVEIVLQRSLRENAPPSCL